MAYAAPVKDHAFLLRDVLKIDRYANLPGFADASFDLVQQILEEGGRFAEEVVAPINRSGDQQGCTWSQDNTVTTPEGWKDAYRQMVDAGWPALSSDPEYGGQGMPAVVSFAFSEMLAAANAAFSMYPGLTHGAYSALHASASDELKRRYLPKLVSGEWGGTMNLTEPQCGTDLGMIRTKAVPNGDGSYRISGQKIWISSASTTSPTTSSTSVWRASRALRRA
jgi:alkylation response protein AidB-like acyl-CoA dehydrogenase